MEKKLTIITVVFNDFKRFKNTFYSVITAIKESNSATEIEYLIKDGGSKDGLHKFLSDYFHLEYLNIVVEKDQGIYSAMNQAKNQAQGKYLLYINCGDKLLKNKISMILDELEGEDIYYFDYLYEGKLVQNQPFTRFLLHDSPCHQSVISKKVLTEFDTNFEIASDFKLLIQNEDKIRKISIPISEFGNEFKPKKYYLKNIEEKYLIIKKSISISKVKKYITLAYLKCLKIWVTYFTY